MPYTDVVDRFAKGVDDEISGVVANAIDEVIARISIQGIKPHDLVAEKDLKDVRTKICGLFAEITGVPAVLLESYKGTEGYFIHRPCGTQVLSMTVYHSVHYKEFGDLGVGSGETRREQVAYCPKCGPVPEEIGEPILESLLP